MGPGRRRSFSMSYKACSLTRRIFITLMTAALVLSACQPEFNTATMAAPQVWRVQVSPAVRWLGPIFNQCIKSLSGTVLLYDEKPAGALDPSKADFTISLQPAAGAAYTAILGRSELVLVVNPANPVNQLSQADLLAIYNGKVSAWADLAKADCPDCAASPLKAIQPYVYASGDEVARIFEGLFPSLSHKLVNGILAPNPQAVLQAVAADPQAIGYLPTAWVDSTVKTVKISDLPDEGLRFPLVLSATAEPQGARLSWLLCVQDAIQ